MTMQDEKCSGMNEGKSSGACCRDELEQWVCPHDGRSLTECSCQSESQPGRGTAGRASTANRESGVRRVTEYAFWKSGIDRCLALVLFAAMLPLLALIAVAIRIDTPGNPVFSQERAGKNGRPFTIHKFRTMYVDNDDSAFREWARNNVAGNAPQDRDADGNPHYKIIADPRVTRVGAFLRKTNLDELPQVINVLKGEMSFVGPRPEMASAVEELYSDWHRARLEATPGITGLWQVSGRGHVSFHDMVTMDIDYIRRQSLRLDAKIVLRTFGTILGRNGS
jgi:lipopolysaccharide/colanic/teichoic acid biosynthesis glycosyltransferase